MTVETGAIRIKRISHLAIRTRDLQRQADFYINRCGLQPVERASHHLYLRASGSHHHVFELLTGGAGLDHLCFQLDDGEDIQRCAHILAAHGMRITLGPAKDVEPGIAWTLRFLDPEGNPIELVSGVAEHHSGYQFETVKPLSLNHAVLYAGDLRKQQSFYEQVLGMRVTDTVRNFMTFLRCNPNHHSFGLIALPRFGLQHAAFDLPSRAELSDLLIHMGDAGVKRIDGPGRHGPGHMLYTYFQDADKNLLEWNTEIQQIDEATHQPRAWDPQPALNLWQTPERLGPPKGLRWLLPALPVISWLSRSRFQTPPKGQAA